MSVEMNERLDIYGKRRNQYRRVRSGNRKQMKRQDRSITVVKSRNFHHSETHTTVIAGMRTAAHS